MADWRKSLRAAVPASVAVIGVMTSSAAWAGVEFCRPFGRLDQTGIDLTKPFLPYDLAVEASGARRAVKIVGDTVILDRNTVGSLIKSPSAADGSISDLSIDAREIIVADSISFKDATVHLSAEKVTFTSDGTLSLLPGAGSRVTISARILSLPSAKSHVFDVRPRAVSADSPDDFHDLSDLLDVTAGALLIGGAPVAEPDAAETLASQFTLAPLFDFRNKIVAAVGGEAEAKWAANTKVNSPWPNYSIRVWQSALVAAPFSDVTRTQLGRLASEYSPLFEQIANAETRYDLGEIKAALSRGTDLQGNGPAWATTKTLANVVGAINGYRYGRTGAPSSSVGSLGTLDDLINLVEQVGNEAPPDTTNIINDLNSKLQTSALDYQNTTQTLAQLQTDIARDTGLLGDLQKNYDVRQAVLKAHADDIQRGKQDRAQLISGLATATSIAATAVTANPTAGAAAGGIVYAVGQSAEGQTAFNSLSAGVQFAQSVRGPLTDASNALTALGASRTQYASFIQSATLSNVTIAQYIDVPVQDPQPGQPKTRRVTRDEALGQLGKQAGALGTSVQGILDVYDKFTPKPSPLPPGLEEDDSLKAIAGDLQTTLADIKLKVASLDATQRQAAAEEAQLVGGAEELAKVAAVDVTNEEGRRNALLLAVSSIRDEFATFSTAINDARRLSVVEYWTPMPLDPALVQRALVSETDANWDPAKVLSSRDVAAAYVKMLKARRRDIAALATRVAQIAQTQFENYVGARGTGPVITRPEEQFTDGFLSPAPRKNFIRLVNQIATSELRALRAHDMKEFDRLALQRVEVPFDLVYRAGAPYPRRLIQAAITEASHSGQLAAGDVTFTLEVERVGNLRQYLKVFSDSDLGLGLPDIHGAGGKIVNADAESGNCVSVDLRRKDSDPAQYYQSADFTIGAIDQHLTFTPTATESFWYLSPNEPASMGRTMQVSFPPAEARTYVRIRLDRNAAWQAAPRFSSMTVKLEVFQ